MSFNYWVAQSRGKGYRLSLLNVSQLGEAVPLEVWGRSMGGMPPGLAGAGVSTILGGEGHLAKVAHSPSQKSPAVIIQTLTCLSCQLYICINTIDPYDRWYLWLLQTKRHPLNALSMFHAWVKEKIRQEMML